MNFFSGYRNIGLLLFLMFSTVVFGFSKDTIVENNQTFIFISKNTETNLLDKVSINKTEHKVCVEKRLTRKSEKIKKVFVVKKEDALKTEQVYKHKVAIFSSKISFLSSSNLPDSAAKIVLKDNFYKYNQTIVKTNLIFRMNMSDIVNSLLTINNSFIHIQINVIDNILTRPPPFLFT